MASPNRAKAFIRALALILAAGLPLSVCAEGTLVVLCYHSFQGRKTEYDIAPDVFEKQMNEVLSLGYRFVKTEDVLADRVSGNKNVLVSIDDGNKSVADIYDRVLRKHDIKPLLFIYPNIIGRASVPYAMSNEQLSRYLREGATLGAHGYYHLFLNEKQYNKDKKGFLKEIYDSRDTLESRFGRRAEVFAYPFGVYSDLARDEIRKAGYRYSFTIVAGTVVLPLSKNPDPYKLNRFLVTKSSWKNVRAAMEKGGR